MISACPLITLPGIRLRLVWASPLSLDVVMLYQHDLLRIGLSKDRVQKEALFILPLCLSGWKTCWADLNNPTHVWEGVHTSVPLPGQKKLAGCAVAPSSWLGRNGRLESIGLGCFGKRTIPQSNRGQICEALLAFLRTVTEVINLLFGIALPLQGISALNLYIFVLVAAQQFNLPYVAFHLTMKSLNYVLSTNDQSHEEEAQRWKDQPRVAALSLLYPWTTPTIALLWMVRSSAVCIPTWGGCRGLCLFWTSDGRWDQLYESLIRGGCVREICQLWMKGGFKCVYKERCF